MVKVKRILFISNYRKGLGGISSQVSLLKDCLDNDGMSRADALNEPHCVLNDGQIGNRSLVIGDCQYKADIFSTKGNPIKRIGLFFKLLWVARKYDVLHIHGCSEWGMLPVVYGVIAGKIWKKRIIVTYHGGEAAEYFAKHGAFARRWLNRADTVIVLSGFLEKIFNEYGIKNIVISNIAKLADAQEHSAYQWEAPRLISVRHLHPLYNIPCILKAFAIVKEQLPGARLTVLGDGEQRKELERLVVSGLGVSGLAESVKFVGQVDNKEMGRYLAESDIMVSAPKVDNMPVSVMEAMNAGVLVISSRVGGVPYMVEDQKTGLLFDIETLHSMTSVTDKSLNESPTLNDDAERLAEKILWAIKHKKECEAIIEAAHEEVTRYSWEEVRKLLLPLYK